MSNQVPVERIIKIEFNAFDKKCKEYFEDVNIEQASNHIWKTICHTAEIKAITEFVIHKETLPRKVYDFKKKLTDEELQKMYS